MTVVTLQEPLLLAGFVTSAHNEAAEASKGKGKKGKKGKKQAEVEAAESASTEAPLDACLFRADWTPVAADVLADEYDAANSENDDAVASDDASSLAEVERAAPAGCGPAVQMAVQGEGVHFYQAYEHQRCVKSWSTAPSVRFCTAPLYVTQAGQDALVYAGIQRAPDMSANKAGRTVWRWKDHENSGLAKKRAFLVGEVCVNDDVYAAAVLIVHPKRLIAVHTDGTVALMDMELCALSQYEATADRVLCHAMAPVKASFLPRTVHRDIVHVGASALVCVATAGTSPATECQLQWLIANAKRGDVREIGRVQLKAAAAAHIIGCALDLKHGSVTVMDSNGGWTSYACTFDAAGFRVQQRVSVPQTDIVMEHQAAIEHVGDGYVACVAAHTTSTAGRLEHRLTVWDTRYGTRQAQCTLAADTLAAPRAGAPTKYRVCITPWSQLVVAVTTSHGGGAGATQRTTVFGSAISCHTMSLLGAIGRASTVGATTPDRSGALVGESGMAATADAPLEDVARVDTWSQAHATVQAAENKLLREMLADGVSVETFTRRYLKSFEGGVEAARARRSAALAKYKLNERERSQQEELWRDPSRHERRLHQAEHAAKKLKRALETFDTDAMDTDESKGQKKARRRELEKRLKEQRKEVKAARLVQERVKIELEYRAELRRVQNGVLPSQPFVAAVLARCFRRQANGTPDLTFWPCNVVKAMLKCGYVSAGYVRAVNRETGQTGGSILLRALADRNAWDLVELAFAHVHDLSERDIVAVLRRVCDRTLAGETTPLSIDRLLACCVGTPVNQTLLIRALHRLPSAHTMLLLESVLGWARRWSSATAGHTEQNSENTDAAQSQMRAASLPSSAEPLDDSTPAYPVMLDAATLLLDAHLALLALTPTAYPLLRELRELVDAEIAADQAWEQLRGVLANYWLRALAVDAASASAKDQPEEWSTHALGAEATAAAAALTRRQAANNRRPKPGRAERMARSAHAGVYGVEVLQF
ncbi:hypothetical protein THASP1DRAFT_23437 [Thamnocephalis sphaerospora]|uniref:Uncharacterized protein n=1 Tax=Thamnocephalis sphaerospora TaxID=78915 RepID=A0A4P9XT67_9FUNG|nr:hypothetical protein THASP1DRAFT_23437 [Thamnocephalis sphaerospora]|eukprot:RKP08610.1 hypothetical protein THASP1DRAFT_23437 [Thamnocephalis sphaerospora]